MTAVFLSLMMLLTACGNFEETTTTVIAQSYASSMTASAALIEIQPAKEAVSKSSVSEINDMELRINGTSFKAVLEKNDTVTAIKELLPLTLEMSELNGNEEYYYLDTTLPSAPEKVGHINEGDIMLYGDSCIVVFYKSFDTSYTYTKIGHIEDTSGLADTLGTGGVSVTFQATVNDTAEYTIQDVRNLCDFLLAKPTEEDLTGKPYDLDNDGVWSVFDLCLMKRKVIESLQKKDELQLLVAYFSRTGNTEKIAEYLIDLTGADSYVIEAAVPYTDEDIQYQTDCRANQEQNDKTVRPEIANPIASIDSYDTIFLGYPIWWGQEPRIIDTFLESYDFSDKTVIPFCTSASSGIAVSEKNISELVPIGNQLAGKRFPASATAEDVKAWYESLSLQ